MKRVGLGGTILLPATAWLASRTTARAAEFRGGLTRGDIAILRLLGLNPSELQAVQIEHTKVLPGFGGGGA